MRDLLAATDRLDSDDALGTGERAALLLRVRTSQQAAAEQVERVRVQPSRAEDFAATLSARLEQDTRAARRRCRGRCRPALRDVRAGDALAVAAGAVRPSPHPSAPAVPGRPPRRR